MIVRTNPNARDAIANGFDLIAEAMEPCIDCGHPSLDDLGETRTVEVLEKIEDAWAEAGEIE
jgi:hypothetical protein